MSELVEGFCEECKETVVFVCDFLGVGEGSRSEYEILQGATAEDDAHLSHDVSLSG